MSISSPALNVVYLYLFVSFSKKYLMSKVKLFASSLQSQSAATLSFRLLRVIFESSLTPHNWTGIILTLFWKTYPESDHFSHPSALPLAWRATLSHLDHYCSLHFAQLPPRSILNTAASVILVNRKSSSAQNPWIVPCFFHIKVKVHKNICLTASSARSHLSACSRHSVNNVLNG